MSNKMNILYQDNLITITDLCIIVNKYYFPLATSKTIMFSEISKISIEDGRKVNHMWGPSMKYLNNWFHFDNNRGQKDRFLSIQIKGSDLKPSLTPNDIDKAFNALRNHFFEMERRSVKFESNRDKQTELEHEEANQMAKYEIEEPESIYNIISKNVAVQVDA